VAANGSLDLAEQLVVGGRVAAIRIRVARGRFFLRGDRAFWAHTAGGTAGKQLATRAAGRWIEVPAQTAGSVSKTAENLAPGHMARCMTEGLGALTKLGVHRVFGQPAVVIRSTPHGSTGGAPGKVWIATRGRPYPLRVVRTGPELAAAQGADPTCGDASSGLTVTFSDLRLSHFDAPVRIAPPAHPLSLQALQAAAGPNA
jgi:hypothetical protein